MIIIRINSKTFSHIWSFDPSLPSFISICYGISYSNKPKTIQKIKYSELYFYTSSNQ